MARHPGCVPDQPTPAQSTSPLDATLIAGLRQDLVQAPYTVERIEEVLGVRAHAALHRDQPLLAEQVTRASNDPVATLVRCFVLGLPVTEAKLAAATPRTGLRGLADLALITGASTGDDSDHPTESQRKATCDLRPYGDERHTWWIASDLSASAIGGPLPTSHVLGVGGASTTLASWTPRINVDRALDLGTGCGVQALHLAGHCASPVVVTDLSERALAYARFTAALNEVDLEFRTGSLLEPVAGEEFDLIVSNPPFVITPRGGDLPLYEYRDGGATGDALVADLVHEIGVHLRPGGIAQLLGNWELGSGEDWRERLSGWLEGTGLDAWVVQREEQDVAEYAETWARDGGQQAETADFRRLYAAWLADFDARGIERVGFGIVTLQRPTADRMPWLDLTEASSGPVASPMGPSVLAGLRARTWLAEHTDDELLDVRWQVEQDVTEERIGRPGALDPQVIQVRQGGGLRRVVRLDTLAAGFVGACDGDLTARQLCAGLAVLTQTTPETVQAQVLAVVRDLAKDGLLRAAAPSPAD